MLISSNHYQCRMRRLFSQLSTLYEESQEDNEDKISEYDIIESIEETISDENLSMTLPVADLLREKLAFITGGTNNRHPILTFPDHFHGELTQDKYNRLVSYLTQVPSEYERQLGFVLIIDRRSDKWMSVKTLLTYIEAYFPCAIECIYILRPNSWLQRALSQLIIYNNLLSCSYHLIICRTLTELHLYVDCNQLSKDLGGTIDFHLNEWIEHQAAIEKLIRSINNFNEMLMKFINKSNEMECPNSVELIEELCQQTCKQKLELEQELKRIQT